MVIQGPNAAAPAAPLAAARAALYRLLAEALAYPDGESVALLRGRYLDDALRAAPLFDADTAAAAHALRRPFDDVDTCVAEQAFVATFGHARPQGTVPYECPYVTTNLFQESDTIADIAGFYRAFAVEPSSRRPERQDHIVLELEFMYLLAFKEADALDREMDALAGICRDAACSFFAAHLGRWGPRFFELLGAPGALASYAAVAKLGTAFLRSEAARFGVSLDPTARPVLLPDDADASCPLASGDPT